MGLVMLLVFLAVRPPSAPAPGAVPAVPEAAIPPGKPAAPAAAQRVPASAPKPAVAAPTAPEPVNVVPETGGGAVRMVRVRPDQTLAAVNGVAITLKDLVPLPPEKVTASQLMSAEMFASLLNRAIDREVTFQAARDQKVELTEAQRQRLAALRARSEQTEPGVFDTVQQNPVNVEFEQRDSTALLLQAALAEKAGVPSPHVTPAQVQAYYQQHQAEFGALPADSAARQAAWAKIDATIRETLAPQLQAEHQERFQKFVQELKAAAQIATAAPGA